MEKQILKEISEKLDLIFKVMAKRELDSLDKDKDKVKFLDSLNMGNETIAYLLDKTKSQVSDLRYNYKREVKNDK